MNAGESYDDLRLTASDAIAALGVTLIRAKMALEESADDLKPSKNWEAAAEILSECEERISEMQYICNQARINALTMEGIVCDE